VTKNAQNVQRLFIIWSALFLPVAFGLHSSVALAQGQEPICSEVLSSTSQRNLPEHKIGEGLFKWLKAPQEKKSATTSGKYWSEVSDQSPIRNQCKFGTCALQSVSALIEQHFNSTHPDQPVQIATNYLVAESMRMKMAQAQAQVALGMREDPARTKVPYLTLGLDLNTAARLVVQKGVLLQSEWQDGAIVTGAAKARLFENLLFDILCKYKKALMPNSGISPIQAEQEFWTKTEARIEEYFGKPNVNLRNARANGDRVLAGVSLKNFYELELSSTNTEILSGPEQTHFQRVTLDVALIKVEKELSTGRSVLLVLRQDDFKLDPQTHWLTPVNEKAPSAFDTGSEKQEERVLHQVVVVGFHKSSTGIIDALKIQQSYGADFGDRGYMYLPIYKGIPGLVNFSFLKR
jgi:hypothetical protein